MSLQPKPGAVVFAKDVSRMATFYEQLLSMSVKYSDPMKVVLESEAISLVIHGIPEQIAATILLTDPPELRKDTAIKLYFPVSSISDARVQASILGGGINPAFMEWGTECFRACDGFDPEGNVIQVRAHVSEEKAKDVC